MKKTLKSLLMLSIFLVACSKDVVDEETPEPEEPKVETLTKEAMETYLKGAYNDQSYLSFTESSTDYIDDRGAGEGADVSSIEKAYKFIDNNDSINDAPVAYFYSCYNAIARANKVINAINKDGNKSEFKYLKGEALLCRAYSHFMLAALFANISEPSNPNGDYAIAYLYEDSVTNSLLAQRIVLATTYSNIEKDLLEGLPLLDDSKFTEPKKHFNIKAAHAFAARFYLFTKNYDKVVSHANLVLSAAAPDLKDYLGKGRDLAFTEFPDLFTSFEEKANLLIKRTKSKYAFDYTNARFSSTPTIFSKLPVKAAGNVSWLMASKVYTNALRTTAFNPKLKSYSEIISGTFNFNYYLDEVLFHQEEVLFNKMEANIYLNNFSEVYKDLNYFQSKRIINYNSTFDLTKQKIESFYKIGNEKEALIKILLDYKKFEFVHEGIRWFDIRRYNLPVTHTIREGGSTNTISLGTGWRRAFQIPQAVIDAGATANPR